MILSSSSKRNIILFVSAFLLCGFLHVALRGVEFADCFSQLFCGTLALLWALSIQKRVTDERLRRLLLWIVTFILLYFLLQIMKYRLFYGNLTVQRQLWYAYYIPMMAIALLCFCLSLSIYRPAHKPLPAACARLIAAGVVLTLGILTNDLHFWAFRFPGGVMTDNGEEQRGWLFYLFTVFALSVFVLSFSVILGKCQKHVARRLRPLPMLPLLAEVLYVVLYALDMDPRIGEYNLWNVGEMFSICTIAFLEACIQTGMIPANKDYEKLFSATHLPAVILDGDGQPVYRTAGVTFPFPENEDTQIMCHPIAGGSIKWAVDMRQIHSLNAQLAEATEQMEARNAYLREETRIKQEKAELETRNRRELDVLRLLAEGLTDKEIAERLYLSLSTVRYHGNNLISKTGQSSRTELAVSAVRSGIVIPEVKDK